jgi:hypothetical protein
MGGRMMLSCPNWRRTFDLLPSTKPNVGAGLLAKAECQSLYVFLIHRFREQARSHIFDRVLFRDQRRLLTSAGTSSPAIRLRNNAVRASSNVVTGTVIDNKIGINQPCNTGPDLSTEK